ncbi:MAG: hypothetical protein R3C46_10430 [Hyphomonadaceae bacterium]
MGRTIADTFDNYSRWLVLFLLLTSIKHGMEAVAYLTDQSTAEALRAWAHWPARAGLAAAIVGVGAYGWGVWRAKTVCVGSLFKQGYVYEAIKRSALVSFLVAGLTTMLLVEFMSDTDLPAAFSSNLIAAVLGTTFCISFFARDLGEVFGGEQESVT